ncbi:MAG: MFS transporter [Hyphomicrobiales bacterium]|nr:MFS transporter [Hyphomicrobiales bacterium]MBV9051473.1 MFS transporter [Hyphomicrobiales bacterium]
MLQRLVAVRPDEVRAVLWCWLYIFALFSSYYIMRPIRDQMGIARGVEDLPWLFFGTLVAMLLVNLPFAWLVKKLPRSRFIPLTYRFFAANIVLFALALHLASPDETVWVGYVFFIWLSVYNLFVVSVFWQLNVDLFSPEQGKRLFGVIAVGATVGGIVGSSITASLARQVSPTFLLISAAVLLEVAVFAASRLARLSPSLHTRPGTEGQANPVAKEADAKAATGDERPIGGGILAGLVNALRSPYIRGIAVFILLYTATSTFAYFLQGQIVEHGLTDRAERTAFFASIDFGVNTLALAVQLFLSGRVITLLGVSLALTLLPALTMAGFAALAATPSLAMIAVFQVMRRAADYAITRPAREVLYTVASREDRYKAKGFIDTFVYRLGDQAGIWASRGLGEIGGRALPFAAIVITAAWLSVGLWLGRRQVAREATGKYS